MRFIVMAIGPNEADPGPPPTPEAFAAMQEYNEAAVKAGVLLAAEGLSPSAKRVKFDGDRRMVVDGPYAEAKEVVAGFSIIKVNSMEEAIEWVKGAPNVTASGKWEVEIRKLMDVEDFGEGFTPNEEIATVKY